MTEQRFAVLIGNSEFPNETGLSPLRCPPHDVQGLTKVLEAADRGQFQVTALINKPRQDIETQLLRILNQAGTEDLVLIYFSGHGRPSNLKGQLYLAALDTQLDLLQATAVAARQIKAFIDDARCNRIILILDCCYSGAIDGDFFKGEFSSQVNQTLKGLSKDEGHGLHIMTASTSVQTAEEKQGDRYSVFTKHIINGIDTGAADKHATGFIRLNELFAYVKEQVKSESTQTPQIFNFGGGDLLIAHSGKSSRKERFNTIRAFLLDLLNRGYIHDEVYSDAIRILGLPESQLTESEKQRDELLCQLYNKEIEPAIFVGKWAVASFEKPIDKPSPVINQQIPRVKKTPYPKRLISVLLVIAVLTAGWTTGKFDSFLLGQTNISPTAAGSIESTAEQQIQIAAVKVREDAAKTAQTQKIKAFEPKMVAIPAGSFTMGSPATEKDRNTNELQHAVTINAFYLGQTEVTKGQFSAFVAATNYLTEAKKGDGCYGLTGTEWKNDKSYNWRNAGFAQTEQHPVVCVSWNDAMAYIAWLNKVTGKSYRLPTEAEWEYAARAGTTTAFSFGDNITPEQVNYDGNYPYAGGAKGWYRQKTVPVMSLPANPWGLHEMHGNVWEWCSDWYDDYEPVAALNPVGPESGSIRVLRGGSWYNLAWLTRSADRSWNVPAVRSVYFGFRLALG